MITISTEQSCLYGVLNIRFLVLYHFMMCIASLALISGAAKVCKVERFIAKLAFEVSFPMVNQSCAALTKLIHGSLDRSLFVRPYKNWHERYVVLWTEITK